MDKEIASLKKQRSFNKRRLTQITLGTGGSIDNLMIRVVRVEKLMTEFTDIEAKLFSLDDEQESDFQYEEIYYKALAGLNKWIRLTSMAGAGNNLETSIKATHSETGHAEIKLPKINIAVNWGIHRMALILRPVLFNNPGFTIGKSSSKISIS